MKKICSYLSLLFLPLVKLDALPLGNPLDATLLSCGIIWEHNYDTPCDINARLCDAWNVRIGYEGNFVFNRRLEVDMHEQDSDIRSFAFYTNACYLVANFWSKVDFFANLGQTKFKMTTPGSAFYFAGTAANRCTTLATETTFSWSVGTRATIWECGKFGIGAEAEYFHTRPDMNYFEDEGFDVLYLSNSRTNYAEYQVGFGGTYRIPIADCSTFVAPYAGIKWSNAQFKPDNYLATVGATTYSLHKLRARSHIGTVIGLTLVGCQMWSFTAEARFTDELACHINTQVRF